MSRVKDYVAIIVCYGGDFVIGEDELEYDGGNEGTIFVEKRKPASYIGFVRDITTYLPCKVGKLQYCIPGQGLRDGLMPLENDSHFADVMYYYLKEQEAKVYVMYDSESEDEDENGESTQVGEDGQGIQASTEVGDADRQDGEERGTNAVEQCADDAVDVTITGLDWEVAQSSDDDDEGLGFDNFLSDDDDEELVQSRRKQRDFFIDKFATFQVPEEVPNRVEGPADAGTAGEGTDYEESTGNNTSEEELEEERRPGRRKKSKFPSYDPSVASPTLSVGMKFHDAQQFREAILKNSIAEQRNIDFIRNTKSFIRARCS